MKTWRNVVVDDEEVQQVEDAICNGHYVTPGRTYPYGTYGAYRMAYYIAVRMRYSLQDIASM